MINTQNILAIMGYGKNCSDHNAALAQSVGKLAGEMGISLAAGNVTGTFAHAFEGASGFRVTNICIIEKHVQVTKPHRATEIFRTEDTFSKHSQIAQMAQAAIIIGGGGGSQLLLNHFLKNKTTVVAIEGSGGVADGRLPSEVLKAKTPQQAFDLLLKPKSKSVVESPFGMVQLTYNHFGLCEAKIISTAANPTADYDEFGLQLREYFSGKQQEFSGKIILHGTDFQRKVWQALLDIPYGRTLEYGELAQIIGDKNSSRAVGHAAGQNPIWVIVPCHRLIGKDGSLTGYAGGLEMKRQLLDLENRQTELPLF
jgi:methylated-DNA-[protein]-cysteine S-methyltransferase